LKVIYIIYRKAVMPPRHKKNIKQKFHFALLFNLKCVEFEQGGWKSENNKFSSHLSQETISWVTHVKLFDRLAHSSKNWNWTCWFRHRHFVYN